MTVLQSHAGIFVQTEQFLLPNSRIFVKFHLQNAPRRFVDKVVSRGVVVARVYFRVTGFRFDRTRVTYSEWRSEWKLYRGRLRCVKGARILIPKDRLCLSICRGERAYIYIYISPRYVATEKQTYAIPRDF